ncbi:MAG TPA: hypothetical protein V6D19_11000 [Stenomitos sp.]
MPTAIKPEVRPKPTVERATNSIRPLQPTPRQPASWLSKAAQEQRPSKLALIEKLQRVSTPTALLMVVVVLPLYGWSVTTQHTWGKQYQQLEALRRDESRYQDLTESQKHDITAQVEQNPQGLVPRSPVNMIPLQPEPPRPNLPLPTSTPIQLNPAVRAPLAY